MRAAGFNAGVESWRGESNRERWNSEKKLPSGT
jgi:hypothetical protein